MPPLTQHCSMIVHPEASTNVVYCSLNCHLFKTYSIKSIKSINASFKLFNPSIPIKSSSPSIVIGSSPSIPIIYHLFWGFSMFDFPSPEVSDLQALLSSEYRAVEVPEFQSAQLGMWSKNVGFSWKIRRYDQFKSTIFFACSITHWVHVKGKLGC